MKDLRNNYSWKKIFLPKSNHLLMESFLLERGRGGGKCPRTTEALQLVWEGEKWVVTWKHDVEESRSLQGLRKWGCVLLTCLVKQSYCLCGAPVPSRTRQPIVPRGPVLQRSWRPPSMNLCPLSLWRERGLVWGSCKTVKVTGQMPTGKIHSCKSY